MYVLLNVIGIDVFEEWEYTKKNKKISRTSEEIRTMPPRGNSTRVLDQFTSFYFDIPPKNRRLIGDQSHRLVTNFV